MPLLLRAFLFTVPRFILILAMVIALNRFDPTPLPQWTVAVLAYFLHFIITFLFGLWTMRGRVLTWLQVGMVTGIFLVVGLLWEIGLYLWMTKASVLEVGSQLNAKSLILLGIYAIAVFAAGAYRRKQVLSASLPEGLTV